MAAPQKNGKDSPLVLRFRAADKPSGLTRSTWRKVAQAHGLSETDAIHRAMVMFATKTGEEVRKLPQEPLPFDLSGFDLTEFAAFAKKTAPDWVEGAAHESGPKA
jgi:hypothetical protein